MVYILVLLLGVLASSKVCVQTAFGKKSVKNSTDAMCFNVFVFIAAAIMFLPQVFGCSEIIWLYSAVGAVFAVSYQLFYTNALSVGNVSMTVLMVNFSMVINVVISRLVYNDSVSFVRLLGICMTIASFVICNGVEKMTGVEKKWIVYTLLAMVSNSLGSLVQKALGESAYAEENLAFISCLYIVSAVMGIIVYMILNKKEKRGFKIGIGMIKYAVGTGVLLGLYQMVYTYALAQAEGTFIFPAQTGSIIIFSTLSGVLIFKDKFTKKQLIGVLIGMIALVFMNY